MRNNLGRFLLAILLSWHVGLTASTYKWSAEISKKEAYINEAIHLKYICEFSDRGELYTIEFNPMADKENYTLELLKKSEKLINGKRISSFEYIAHASRVGKLEFNFDVQMKKTTLAFIADSTGSKDDDRGDVDSSKKIISQKTLNIDIKEADSEVVGKFKIDVKKDTPKVKAFEPYHLQITISGIGSFQNIKEIKFDIPKVNIFHEKVIKNTKLTSDGHSGTLSQKFAFVSENNFTIPSFQIQYFDLKSQSLKSMNFNSIDVEVTKGFKKEELLDSELESGSLSFLSYIKNYIYYILTFIAGFLLAKIKFKNKKTDKKNDSFTQKIKNSNSLDELSIILILQDERKYKELILDIESKNIGSLSEGKRKASFI